MAYVSVSFKGESVGKWPLNGTVTIGRSADCDIAVRDILLSRRHCQIVPYRSGWIAVDLGSKNGTKSGGVALTRRGLSDGDVLTMGKTTVRFYMGRLPDDYKAPARRPADPFEALTNTVSAFDAKAAEAFRRDNKMPHPQPQPREPASFEKDGVASLVNEIVSSSWDSIYAQASQPKRPIPRLPGPLAAKTAPRPAPKTEPAAAPPTTPPAGAAPRQSRHGFAEELQVRPPREVFRATSPLAAPATLAVTFPPPPIIVFLHAVLHPLVTLRRWMRGE